jgi:L-fuconolactonase
MSATVSGIVDPHIDVVDSHHHLWNRSHQRYLVEEFEIDASTGHRVVGSIFAECHEGYLTEGPRELRPVGEARFFAGEAARHRQRHGGTNLLCNAFIGAADMTLGRDVDRVLDALDTASEGSIRGIRGAVYWDEDLSLNLGLRPYSRRGLLLDPQFRAGVARLVARGWVYDAWQYEPQLPELCSLADALPSATIVVSHCGGPLGVNAYAGPGALERWQKAIREIARRDNVLIKLSGLSAKRIGLDFSTMANKQDAQTLAALWRPYVETCVSAFGPQRCMFASNFPVDAVVADYRTLVNAYKLCLSGYSDAEKRQVFSENAVRTYRLSLRT